MTEKAEIMDQNAIERAVSRISYEIIERNRGAENLAVIGILTRGAPLAWRIADKIRTIENISVPVGELDITSFRDDRNQSGQNSGGDRSKIDFPVAGQRVVLVDDVLYTGRSARAAIDAVLHRGRPINIQLAALIDRGHRELPIRCDYIGKNVPTSSEETVKVMLQENDGINRAAIYTNAEFGIRSAE